jgi:hypothetical protein
LPTPRRQDVSADGSDPSSAPFSSETQPSSSKIRKAPLVRSRYFAEI